MIRNRDHGEVESEERALIGSILLNPSMVDAMSGITEQTFLDKELGKVFGIIRAMHESGKPIDRITLLTEVRRQSDLQPHDIAELFSEVPNATNARFYADNVAEASRLRSLLLLAERVTKGVGDRTMTADAILCDLEAEIESLQGSGNSTQWATIADAGRELILELSADKKNQRSCEFGISTIDNTVGRLMPGEVVILAARPGVGKTSFAMQVALTNAKLDRPVLFVSLEMRRVELAGRVFAGISGVPGEDIRMQDLSDAQMQALREAVEFLDGVPLVVFDPPSASARDIRARAKQSGDVCMIVVDYLSLVRPSESRVPREQQISAISRDLKMLAKELKVPVLCLQQFNRAADTEQSPKLSHLRESGAIEQDADIVMFIHPQSVKGMVSLIIAKHRHGRTGQIDLEFNGEKTSFSAIKPSQFGGFEAYS